MFDDYVRSLLLCLLYFSFLKLSILFPSFSAIDTLEIKAY